MIEDVEDTLEKDIEGDREAGDCGGEDESEDVVDKSVCSKNKLNFTMRYYNMFLIVATQTDITKDRELWTMELVDKLMLSENVLKNDPCTETAHWYVIIVSKRRCCRFIYVFLGIPSWRAFKALFDLVEHDLSSDNKLSKVNVLMMFFMKICLTCVWMTLFMASMLVKALHPDIFTMCWMSCV